MTSMRFIHTRPAPIRAVAGALAFLLVVPVNTVVVIGQTPTPSSTAKPAQAAPGTEKDAKLTADQLDALVAPIALYADPLLSQSLVASTYPLELVQAQQWAEKNKNLKGDELTKAVEKQPWDASVQATVVIPDLLKRLTEDITWTHNLGNAFLEQQDDVMTAVQRLRKKAKDAGKLDSSEQQKVETKTVESKTIIEIQPVSTTVVYVPAYSPTVIWGPMYYPYPPIYYPPYYGGAWLGFGVGIAVGIGISGGWGWGCGWGGGGNNVYINHNNNFNRINTGNINTGNIGSGNRSNWNHNPSHRGGAPYASTNTANKFGGSNRAGAGTTGANRPGVSSTGANRPTGSSSSFGSGSASRPAGGDRVGTRSVPTTTSRPTGGGFGGSSSMGSASRARSTSSRGGGSMGGGGGRR